MPKASSPCSVSMCQLQFWPLNGALTPLMMGFWCRVFGEVPITHHNDVVLPKTQFYILMKVHKKQIWSLWTSQKLICSPQISVPDVIHAAIKGILYKLCLEGCQNTRLQSSMTFGSSKHSPWSPGMERGSSSAFTKKRNLKKRIPALIAGGKSRKM